MAPLLRGGAAITVLTLSLLDPDDEDEDDEEDFEEEEDFEDIFVSRRFFIDSCGAGVSCPGLAGVAGVPKLAPPATLPTPPLVLFTFCFFRGDLMTIEKLGRNDLLVGV